MIIQIKGMSGGNVMRRTAIVLGVFTVLVLFGCAKAADPVKPAAGLLTIDHIYPTVGDPLDVSVDDTKLYIAEDQAGLSVYDRQTSLLKDRFFEYGPKILRVKTVSVIPSLHRLYLVNSTDSDQILIFDTDNLNGVNYSQILGQTSDVKWCEFMPASHEYTYYAQVWNPYALSSAQGLSLKGYSTIKYTYAITDPSSVNTDTGQDVFDFGADLVIKGVTRDDQYVYTAADQRGLVIFRIMPSSHCNTDDPLPFVQAGEADTPGEACALVLSGDYVYIADAQGGLQTINVADPANPFRVDEAAYATDAFARSIAVDGNYLLVGTYGDGVYLFDISNPAKPQFKDHIDKADIGYVNRIETYDGKFWVASRDKGVVALSVAE
jgi:hypothetical protein